MDRTQRVQNGFYSDIDSLMEASSQNDPLPRLYWLLLMFMEIKVNIFPWKKLTNLQKFLLIPDIGWDILHWVIYTDLSQSDPNFEESETSNLSKMLFKIRWYKLIKLAARKDPIASYVLGRNFYF